MRSATILYPLGRLVAVLCPLGSYRPFLCVGVHWGTAGDPCSDLEPPRNVASGQR
jgi:hypothetical protein